MMASIRGYSYKMPGYEILEHTADVGLRANAPSLTELFEQATYALLEITGASDNGAGTEVTIEVTARDLAAVLVDWLSEVLYEQDARDAVVTDVKVNEVRSEEHPVRAIGSIWLKDRSGTLEGTAVKAITYHQLKVEEMNDEWLAEVYVDV
jgi:SHS2 domain-containing protein